MNFADLKKYPRRTLRRLAPFAAINSPRHHALLITSLSSCADAGGSIWRDQCLAISTTDSVRSDGIGYMHPRKVSRMVGWRGSRVRNPAFGDQPSRADSIQSSVLNRCNVAVTSGGRQCDLAEGCAPTRSLRSYTCRLGKFHPQQGYAAAPGRAQGGSRPVYGHVRHAGPARAGRGCGPVKASVPRTLSCLPRSLTRYFKSTGIIPPTQSTRTTTAPNQLWQDAWRRKAEAWMFTAAAFVLALGCILALLAMM